MKGSSNNSHEKGNNKDSSSTSIRVPELSYQLKPNQKDVTNFVEWRKKMQAYIETEYPDEGTFISRNKYWIRDPPRIKRPTAPVTVPASASPEEKAAIDLENELIDENNEFQKLMYKEKIRSYSTYEEDSRKARTQMFHVVFNTLSESSKARLSENVSAFKVDIENARDVLKLWNAINVTHSTINSGTRILDTLSCLTNLVNIKMYSNKESSLEFKERLVRLIDLNVAAKGPLVSEELAAAIYFQGLDQRYLPFQQGVQNHVILI